MNYLTDDQLTVLGYLAAYGPSTPGRVASGLGVDLPSGTWDISRVSQAIVCLREANRVMRVGQGQWQVLNA